MPVPVKDTSIVATGLSRLTVAYRNKKYVRGITAGLLWSCQDFINVAWTVLESKLITSSPPPSGDALDRIGAIVGEARQGRSDASYFPAVLLRIRVNRSRGLVSDILTIAQLISGAPPSYSEHYPAAFSLVCNDIPAGAGSTLVTLIGQAKAGGVRATVTYTEWPFGMTLATTTTPQVNNPGILATTTTPQVTNPGLLASSTDTI